MNMNLRFIIKTVAVAIGLTAGHAIRAQDLFSLIPREPFVARLETNGACLLLSTEAAARQYGEALSEARKLHPNAAELVFQPDELSTVEKAFKKHQPRFALVFILPDELDVNFAWQWLRLTTQLDDDPFVDVRTGFITGENPTAAANFVRRIRSVVESKTPLLARTVDNVGLDTSVSQSAFSQSRGSFFIPVFAERVALSTISHGAEGFTQSRVASMDGAGMIHFGGHGYPDRIVDGLSGALARQLKLAPCVVFNGACYTGVTGRWFDMPAGGVERRVAPENSFCLSILASNVLGYFAALHPDHGMPVYQEMEFLATEGASLGDIIKHTHDGVILGAGGKLPMLKPLRANISAPPSTASEVMLNGTAARVLFGDPALVLTGPFTAAPFQISVRTENPDTLRVTAIVKNGNLKATFTDTYHADLASDPTLFNDRALITCELPQGWTTVRTVEIVRVMAKSRPLKSRLVGFGVEQEGARRLLHVQVDVPTTGYMRSGFRTIGASVELKVQR